ncbi:hypothetical protein WMY93_004721 [Mugilogobius chulae]|uniref:CRAL-TRIO domain-containing protein n=1 Tax=Mugilogobius chulae TaxID=88201 RepID=A0AAW0PVH4_9GOBI
MKTSASNARNATNPSDEPTQKQDALIIVLLRIQAVRSPKVVNLKPKAVASLERAPRSSLDLPATPTARAAVGPGRGAQQQQRGRGRGRGRGGRTRTDGAAAPSAAVRAERSGRPAEEREKERETHAHALARGSRRRTLHKLVYGENCDSTIATQADMEAFLRSVQRQLTEDVWDTGLHVVLGGPQPDVDTVAATLCLALHLRQKQLSEELVVPVLCREEAPLSHHTRSFLGTLGLSEDLLLWRNQLDLVSLQDQGRLSLTLLREELIDSPENCALKSSVRRVVHRRGQRDEEAGSSATLGEALRLQREALWLQHGQRSEEVDELLRRLEQISYSKPPKLPDWEQLLTKDPKEFSDGEMTIVLTSVTMETEEGPDLAECLKSFCHRHGYDGVVLLLSISDAVCHSRQQVAVYANNTDVLKQLCCELEESSSWSLSGELDAKKNFQVYHIPVNTIFPGTPPILEQEVQAVLQDFVDARGSVLACHPSSRTSSTEGVAGSIDFSQSSSGITDMDGGDMERGETESGEGPENRALGDGAEEEDEPGAGAAELVSPDSGLTTIRSSRSSKESYAFLSDESPMGDLLTGPAPSGPGQFLRNPSPLGLLSLSPPVPPERRRNRANRNKTDNVDLFSFDPLHSASSNTDADQGGRPSSSEMEELSLVDFSAPTSVSGLDSRNSSIDFHIQTVVPPTPVNSLVGSRPPSSCGVRFFPEDVIERINGLQHKDSVSSSLSETWDEFSFDTQGALSSSDNSSWNVAKTCESPQNILEVIKNNETNDTKEEISTSDTSKVKVLEPQLSLIIEQTETHDKWNPDRVIHDKWNSVTLADLQLTPPEEEVVVKRKTGILAPKDKKARKKELLQTLTPDTSKEEEEETKKTVKNPAEILDFWTYSAQKGFLKSDSRTTTSYPESLDMWNMTIRDDSLNTPDCLSENSGGSFCGVSNNGSMESPQEMYKGMAMWNTTIREDSSSTIASSEGKDTSQVASLQTSPVTAENINIESSENVQNNEVNVKIVIENADQENSEDTEQTGDATEIANQVSDPWELPVPGMVTSTSEYDNFDGGATWSLSSSPDSSLTVDLIQLEAQSSPFVGVTQTKDEKTTTQINQVFTYEGLKESDDRNKAKKDSATSEQSGGHSPFMLVEVSQQVDQSVSAKLFNWDELVSKTQENKTVKEESNQGLVVESETLLSKTVSSGSSVGEREGCKMSPGSRDELRSSDGDSSSGLEMESIIVSGTVKEAERVRPVAKEVKKSMETFSMLSYAATILQAQAAHKHKEETCSGLSQKVSIPKIVSPSQSESLNKLELTQDDNDKQAAPQRSTSPSLRFPSDHFLKTREEVYVHSQISMEDSDEGGQSPLGNIQVWSETLDSQCTQGRPLAPTELVTPTQVTPQTATPGSSELASPVVTDSSVSRSSSYTDSSLSETAPPAEKDRGLALPFSGDLMEEDEETEEETKEHSAEQPTGQTQLLHHQDVPSQAPLQLQGDQAFQWAEGDGAVPVQTQYGYNYHHIDQRTEHPSSPKNDGRERGGEREAEVYAEFTSVSRSEGHYQPRVIRRTSAAHGSGHYPEQSAFEGDSEEQQQQEQQEEHTGRGDHARYVSDGYVHFLLSRQSQQEENAADMGSREDAEELDNREDPSSSADVSAGSGHRRKLSAPPLNISLDQSEGSVLSDTGDETGDETGDDLDLNMDDMDTPDEADSVDFDAQHGECEEAAAAPSAPGQSRESRLWRSVLIGEQEHRIDMKSIEPYKRVISHGGYYEEQHAIIVFAACFLPDSDCDNYNYVMENLFLYVISTLELMVAEDYMIVYLNGATPRRRTPGFSWMKKCYHMIDRRLKKNLKMFIIVHPSFFIRTLLGITRPFISSKFSSKIRYVHSLQELGQIIPMEYVHIPPSIIRFDDDRRAESSKSHVSLILQVVLKVASSVVVKTKTFPRPQRPKTKTNKGQNRDKTDTFINQDETKTAVH